MVKSATARIAGTVWLIATLSGSVAIAGPSSIGGSELEVRELAAFSPQAVTLVAEAEREAREGNAKAAWYDYAHAWTLAPRNAIPARGICRLALALGIHSAEERHAAREACTRALLLGGTPEDIRNNVASLVDGDPPPTMDDLVAASVAVDGAVRTGPGQPWGAAARADLALRLGDRELLDSAVLDLEGTAPGHPETRRMVALASDHVAPARRIALLAIALLLALTVASAVRGWLLGHRRGAMAAVAGVLILAAGPARAAIDDAHPEKSVPTAAQQMADPLGFANLLMELGARAEAATTRGDHPAAARYYAALAQAVPERSYAFSRLCDALDASGKRAEALQACGAALTRRGAVAGDFTHFVKLLLAKDGPLTSEERRQADGALAALDREPRAGLIAARVRCNVAVHEHDLPGLEACTSKLAMEAPSEPSTIGFQWTLAIERDDRAEAKRQEARAVAAGVDAATVAHLRSVTIGSRALRFARAIRYALEGLLAFVLVALIGRALFRRVTAAVHAGAACSAPREGINH